MNFHSYFHFKWISERERERERRGPRAPVQSDDRRRTPSSSPRRLHAPVDLARPFDFAGKPRERSNLEPRSQPRAHFADKPRALRLRTLRLHRSTSTSNRTQIATFDFAGEPRALRLRRSTSTSNRNWEMVGFWWIWPDLMNFFFVGFCFGVYQLRNGIIYSFGNRENVSNK